MNYQTTTLWFYSPYHLLLVVAVIAATFLGLTAPILYFLVIGLLFPVLVSMRLHILSENGKATLIKEREEWMVYVQGIPVHETRASLKNPCFSTPERLRQFFYARLYGESADPTRSHRDVDRPGARQSAGEL